MLLKTQVKNRLSLPLIPMILNLLLSVGEIVWLLAKLDGVDSTILVCLIITKGICWLFILGQLKITPIHWSNDA